MCEWVSDPEPVVRGSCQGPSDQDNYVITYGHATIRICGIPELNSRRVGHVQMMVGITTFSTASVATRFTEARASRTAFHHFTA